MLNINIKSEEVSKILKIISCSFLGVDLFKQAKTGPKYLGDCLFKCLRCLYSCLIVLRGPISVDMFLSGGIHVPLKLFKSESIAHVLQASV